MLSTLQTSVVALSRSVSVYRDVVSLPENSSLCSGGRDNGDSDHTDGDGDHADGDSDHVDGGGRDGKHFALSYTYTCSTCMHIHAHILICIHMHTLVHMHPSHTTCIPSSTLVHAYLSTHSHTQQEAHVRTCKVFNP